MYMVSSLRTGMISVSTHAQIKEIKQELQLYESIKNQYLAQETNTQEKKVYEEIISQISLLESKASENKKSLAKQYQAVDLAHQTVQWLQNHTVLPIARCYPTPDEHPTAGGMRSG